MSDPRALVRVLDELLWALRRRGLLISTAQSVDAARALDRLGLDDPTAVREALAAVLVQRNADRRVFDATFQDFFHGARRSRGTLWERLSAAGFDEGALDVLRAALGAHSGPGDGLAPLGTLLERAADLDRLLAVSSLTRRLDAHAEMQLGFLTHRLLGEIGTGHARVTLARLRMELVEALGAVGSRLADALASELDATEDDVRDHVRATYEERAGELRRAAATLDSKPFASLSVDEVEEVRRAVRALGERLRGGARVRARHDRRGRLDPHRTLRAALRTAGVPFRPVRRRRQRERPRLVLLCDVSDSVRTAATFLLEFTYAAHDVFDRTRSFVFVSEIGETTSLFEREPVSVAIARAWGGGVIPAADNSNYGRALRSFADEVLPTLDRRTTVVILGDGRTNYLDPAAHVLDRLRERARAVLWLCPEPRGLWAQGDSAMPVYAPRCTTVVEVASAADLRRAASLLVARG